MTLTATELASPLARYAERFHAALGDGHHVASPLGAWLLLALAASAARGDERAQLAEILGVDVNEAAATARVLLSDPHPIVGAAAAVWHRPEVITDALHAWLHALPHAVETGRMPTQDEADAWARDHSLGLIERFPLRIDERVKVLLASALATRVSWLVPFELAPAAALGPDSRWASTLTQALRTPTEPHTGASMHQVYLAATPQAGNVAVHTAIARNEERDPLIALDVTSVIAARDVPAGEVLAAAYDLATAPMRAAEVPRLSLFDLPLGDGPSWSIAEEPVDTAPGRPERCVATLPAWSAHDDHDLSAPALGFPPAADALIALLPPAYYDWVARQSVMARYDRVGFEAAAVTGFAIRTSAQFSRTSKNRTAEVRFGHPFAVVAVTSDTQWDPATNEVRSGPWHGVPVFSAWVTEPDDANDDENGPGAA